MGLIMGVRALPEDSVCTARHRRRDRGPFIRTLWQPENLLVDRIGNIMKIRGISFGFVLVLMLGCTATHSDSERTHASPPAQSAAQPSTKTPSPSPAKPLRITGIGKVNFSKDDPALVLNYETDISIDDMESLRKEVDTIWETFRKDVEKAQLKCGVIRATHYESSGFLRQGKGYGFVFKQGDDGKWRLLDDNKEKK